MNRVSKIIIGICISVILADSGWFYYKYYQVKIENDKMHKENEEVKSKTETLSRMAKKKSEKADHKISVILRNKFIFDFFKVAGIKTNSVFVLAKEKLDKTGTFYYVPGTINFEYQDRVRIPKLLGLIYLSKYVDKIVGLHSLGKGRGSMDVLFKIPVRELKK